jgi:hypothetical protein
MAEANQSTSGLLGVLRAVALIAAVAGAAGSVVFVLRNGQHNPSRILIGIFVAWVLSPFVAFALANVLSKRWSVLTGTTLHVMTLILIVISVAIYGNGVGLWGSKPAFVFLMVPLASWVLMAIAIPIAVFVSRRGTKL